MLAEIVRYFVIFLTNNIIPSHHCTGCHVTQNTTLGFGKPKIVPPHRGHTVSCHVVTKLGYGKPKIVPPHRGHMFVCYSTQHPPATQNINVGELTEQIQRWMKILQLLSVKRMTMNTGQKPKCYKMQMNVP